MKTFRMMRRKDESGISGTGVVLEGVIFQEGECVIRWLSIHSSVNVFKTFADFVAIHVTSHPTNGTQIEFSDGSIEEY